MTDISPGKLITFLLFVAIVLALFPFVNSTIQNANNQYFCEKDQYPIQSANLKICSNVSDYACLNAAYPILNNSALYCMNSTGQHIIANRGFNIYNESSTYRGPSIIEFGLLGVMELCILAGMLFFALVGFGVIKPK